MIKACQHIKKRRFVGMAAGMALLALGQPAFAQSGPPWTLNGSDTWFDVITRSLIQCNSDCPGTDNTNTISNLIYAGGGSGTAETNMTANKQSIGPMSRNFKQAVLTANPTFTPSLRNVGGLDAGVIITRGGAGHCPNINLPKLTGSPTEAAPNNSTGPFTWGVSGSGYTQLMAIVLGGVDGSGSVPACASERRIQAIQDLAACEGIDHIEHFYRRDDNSGTTDTFKEKLKIANFCNGRARGILGTITTNHNLNNQDMDPIRRPCPLANPTLYRATTCTDMTTGLSCTSGANCSQGLVVAMSDPDPNDSDVTVSIGKRVGLDTTKTSMGYAGREGSRQSNASGPFINTVNYSNANVRLDAYMLSRRLYFQYGSLISDAVYGGANQVATELKFYDWATNPDGGCNGKQGRCNLDPILTQYGFIPCTNDCTSDPTGSSNLCSKGPYPAAAATTNNCIPAYTDGTAWGYGQVACAAGTICCSTGLACPASGLCPAVTGVTGLAPFSACTKAADCAAGTCSDALGVSTNVCS